MFVNAGAIRIASTAAIVGGGDEIAKRTRRGAAMLFIFAMLTALAAGLVGDHGEDAP